MQRGCCVSFLQEGQPGHGPFLVITETNLLHRGISIWDPLGIFRRTVPQVLATLVRDRQEDKDCPPILQKPKLKFNKVVLLILHPRIRKQDNWTANEASFPQDSLSLCFPA